PTLIADTGPPKSFNQSLLKGPSGVICRLCKTAWVLESMAKSSRRPSALRPAVSAETGPPRSFHQSLANGPFGATCHLAANALLAPSMPERCARARAEGTVTRDIPGPYTDWSMLIVKVTSGVEPFAEDLIRTFGSVERRVSRSATPRICWLARS